MYQDQGHKLVNKDLQKELHNFFKDRFKYYLKEKEIRYDIIDASISSFSFSKYITWLSLGSNSLIPALFLVK